MTEDVALTDTETHAPAEAAADAQPETWTTPRTFRYTDRLTWTAEVERGRLVFTGPGGQFTAPLPKKALSALTESELSGLLQQARSRVYLRTAEGHMPSFERV